mgnify:FL=1
MEKRHRKQPSLLKSLLLGGGMALLFGAVLVMAVSAVLLRAQDPTAHLLPAGLACLGLTALMLGICTVRMWRHDSLFPALIAGAVFAILIGAGGLAIPGSTLPVAVRCAGIPAVFLIALLGGFLARPRRARRRHH